MFCVCGHGAFLCFLQEGMMSQAVFLLSEHLHCNAYSAAFPEMAIPTLVVSADEGAARER